MNVHVKTEGGVTLLRPSGPSLDAASARDFRREFLRRVPADARVVLDLGAVEFVDSAGCGAILVLARHLSPEGDGPGRLAICGATPPVRSLFEMVRMHHVVDLFHTREEAARSFVAARPARSLIS